MKMLNNKFVADLMGVYISAAFCVYNWSLIIFFWYLPSFLLQWTATEILSYLGYQMVFAMIESLGMTACIALLALVLPARFLRNNLRTSGTALVAAFAVNCLLYFAPRGNINAFLAGILSMDKMLVGSYYLDIWEICLILLPIGFVMSTKSERIKQALNRFTDNASVLVALDTILSLLGVLIIIYRNI